MVIVVFLIGSAAASDFIHTTATLSQARYYLSATSVNNKVIFAGYVQYYLAVVQIL